MAGDLSGTVAVVTGAARDDGIGHGIVRALLQHGARGVVFGDIEEATGRATLAALERDFPGRTQFLRHDVTSLADWEAVTTATLASFGALHILVNNAGIPLVGTISNTDLATFQRGMAINFESQYIGIRHCAPILAAHAGERIGGSVIINNSSMAAYLVDPGNVAYHVSKAAGRMLTMCAAREFGPVGIRVNSVHYGPTLTAPMREAMERYASEGDFADARAAHEGIAALSPLNTIGTIDEAGALVAYLASDDARFITGGAYWHDGGCFMQY